MNVNRARVHFPRAVRIACTLACVPLVLLLGTWPASGETFDRPVTKISTDEEGVYRAGFMYWYGTQTLFAGPAEFVVLGQVIRMTQVPRLSELWAGTMRGQLRVDEVVVCPDSLMDQASGVRIIEADGFDGLAVGDTVLVFMVRYEGEYAIPNWARDTHVGYRLHHAKDELFCDDLQFVQLLRSGHAWDLGTLSFEELCLWRCVDSDGLLAAFIRARMMSEEESRVRE